MYLEICFSSTAFSFYQHGISPWCSFLTRDYLYLRGDKGINKIHKFRTEIIYKVSDWDRSMGRWGRESLSKQFTTVFSDMLFSDYLWTCVCRHGYLEEKTTATSVTMILEMLRPLETIMSRVWPRVCCMWAMSHAESVHSYPEYNTVL